MSWFRDTSITRIFVLLKRASGSSVSWFELALIRFKLLNKNCKNQNSKNAFKIQILGVWRVKIFYRANLKDRKILLLMKN